MSDEPVKSDAAPAAEIDVNPRVAALLGDAEVVAAYEAHRSKTPVREGDEGQRASLADSIVQYLVIMRDEKIAFASDAKNAEKQIVHAAGGNLFVGLTAYNVVTVQGRAACIDGIINSKLTARELAVCLQKMSMTLANAPRVEGVEVDQSDFGSVIDMLLKRCKTKEDLASALKALSK